LLIGGSVGCKEVIACFVDIGGIVDHHYLSLQPNCRQGVSDLIMVLLPCVSSLTSRNSDVLHCCPSVLFYGYLHVYNTNHCLTK